MAIRVKDGVELDGVDWSVMWLPVWAYDALRTMQGWGDGTLTSGVDSGDSYGPARRVDSAHPHGYAVDLRKTDLPARAQALLASQLRALLAPYGFTVVDEPDHYHVQLTRWRDFA